jgi:adenosylcobinamide-phosphate synthase
MVELHLLAGLAALLIEALVGYPQGLTRRVGHPVTWMGALIGLLDTGLNRQAWTAWSRRGAGALALLILILAVAVPAVVLERGLHALPFGAIAVAFAASTLIAQRSLYDHVARVADALDRDGLAAGRAAVAHIVGRDPDRLDAAGVARAAIESLAENFSDAVVAPALWLIVGGLAGGAVYKAINTADSMIGHRTPRHQAFGWAAARLDDLVNLPASRLAALLIVVAAAVSPRLSTRAAAAAWAALRRDAARHRSPNAGYPEAATAGALGLKLAGPRFYAGVRVADAPMGDGRWEATAADIRAALALYQRADGILIALVAALTLLVLGGCPLGPDWVDDPILPSTLTGPWLA